jgi:hypothetical protein
LFGNQPTQPVQNNMGFSFNTPQPNFQVTYQQPQAQTNQNLLGFGNLTLNTKPTPNITTNTNTNQFTFNTATTSSNDEFGGFDQGHK